MAEGSSFIKKHAPTLYAIIATKLIKGSLLLLVGLGVYRLHDNNLPAQFRELLEFLHLDPERAFFTALASRLGQITPSNVIWVATGTVLYSLFSLVEGTGLMFRVSWAGWLAISESAFFIPIEIYEFIRRDRLAVLGVLAINVAIVWYLLQNRQRLFRHHHPRP